MRDELERVEVPGSDAAAERARAVVLQAFREREPVPRRSRAPLVAIAAAVAAAVGLAVASPPGRAVVDRVRELVGVERAQPALFALPGGGRLLVSGTDGTWVVDANGKKRLLAAYFDASWSPFGRFVVATRGGNELAALEPDGDVRWTLARPDVHSPRWTGTATDTRIAYLDRSGLRVVAGDGTADRLLATDVAGPLAWRPGARHELAYVSSGDVVVRDVETGRLLWRARAGVDPLLHTDLEWSPDGTRVLVVNDGTVQVFGRGGRLVTRSSPTGGRVTDAVFLPGTQRVVVARTRDGESDVAELATGRKIFAGTGVFEEITPSSDGRWVAVEWRTADQWVFVRTTGGRRIRAYSGIAGQFGGGQAVVSGWCCSG